MFQFQDECNRNVRQFHYTAWPDHGVPETSQSIVQFVSQFRLHENKHGSARRPTVIHCR